MAQVDFNQFNRQHTSNTQTRTNSEKPQIGFFSSLKNDGDEAIVRFMHHDTSSFDIVTTHPITLNGKFRKVNCIRNADEPFDNCPMCKAGAKIEQKIYIKLLEYVKQPDGTYLPEAKVWERSASYANILASKMTTYGPLDECLFTIKRHGNYVPSLGSKNKVSYDIDYAPEKIYPNENFPVDNEVFANYKAVGRIVMDKSYEELEQFEATGSFPEATQNVAPQEVNRTESEAVNSSVTPGSYYDRPATYTAPPTQTTAYSPSDALADNGIQRPVRRY